MRALNLTGHVINFSHDRPEEPTARLGVPERATHKRRDFNSCAPQKCVSHINCYPDVSYSNFEIFMWALTRDSKCCHEPTCTGWHWEWHWESLHVLGKIDTLRDIGGARGSSVRIGLRFSSNMS